MDKLIDSVIFKDFNTIKSNKNESIKANRSSRIIQKFEDHQ